MPLISEHVPMEGYMFPKIQKLILNDWDIEDAQKFWEPIVNL